VRVGAFESGAGEIAEAGASAAGLRLEQLPGIPQTADAALAVAAGGAVVRRDAVAQGQRGGAAGIRAADGNAAAAGKRRRGVGGDPARLAAIRRGWFFGADELKQELLAQASERVGAQHYGTERQESGEAKAERLVRGELKKLRGQGAHRPTAAHGRVDACIESAAGYSVGG